MNQKSGVSKELQPTTSDTPATTGEKEVWTCARVVDERKQIICGDPAVDEVLVRNDAGLFCVALCEFHKREHFEFYKRRRSARAQSKVQGNATSGPFRTKGAPFRPEEPTELVGEVLERDGVRVGYTDAMVGS